MFSGRHPIWKSLPWCVETYLHFLLFDANFIALCSSQNSPVPVGYLSIDQRFIKIILLRFLPFWKTLFATASSRSFRDHSSYYRKLGSRTNFCCRNRQGSVFDFKSTSSSSLAAFWETKFVMNHCSHQTSPSRIMLLPSSTHLAFWTSSGYHTFYQLTVAHPFCL